MKELEHERVWRDEKQSNDGRDGQIKGVILKNETLKWLLEEFFRSLLRNNFAVEAKDSRELMPADVDADGIEDKIACAEESACAENFSVCGNG